MDVRYKDISISTKKNTEEKLEKKLTDINSFNDSVNNNKNMITYFENENRKSKGNCEKYKMLATNSKRFDTFGNFATVFFSVTLSVIETGSILIPTSTGVVCGKY